MMAVNDACWKKMGVIWDSHIYILLSLLLVIIVVALSRWLSPKIREYMAPLISPYLEEYKQWLKDTYRNFIKWLHPNLTNKKDVQFQSLAPTDNAEQTEIYEEALTQALLNKNIYNIAITGAFGSGKSSFLRTYFKKYPNLWPFGGKKNKVITASLANLANDTAKSGAFTDVNQKIELSILHQLFFHERATSLTDSHFTKIQKFEARKLCGYTTAMMAYIISCVHLLWPRWLTATFELQKLGISEYREWWHWTSAIIALSGTVWIIYHLVRVIAQLVVRKFSVNSASIEIASKREKSILNEHIDEIIYFFSVTGYNVVLIEDLDRLKQQGIFVKLREINHLINNSEEVKQRVRFIYALKDDMFKDETRTKFFDFIIPIIPRVDASNAGDALRGLIPNYLGSAADAVAMYLNDARTLSNIANEFNIYKHQQQHPNVRGEEQLFALVVYKNLYPDDFEALRLHNGGMLATALQQRNTLVKQKIDEIDEKLKKLRADLTEIKYDQMQSEKELRLLLVGFVAQEAMSSNDAYGGPFNQVKIGNQLYPISSLLTEDNFNDFIKMSSVEYRSSNNKPKQGTSMKKLLEEVYGVVTYEERMRRIKERANLSQYEEEEKQLIAERTPTKQQTIQQLLQSKQMEIEWGEKYTENRYETQRRFIDDMLRGGYITEDYADFISFFHEGAMTSEDYEFVRNVKLQVTGDKELNLTYTKKIIDILDISHFSQPEILHVKILDELLEHYPNEEKCNLVIKMLEQYSDARLQFILKYVEDGKNAVLLIERLCANAEKQIWKKISTSSLTEAEKISLLKVIIAFGKEDDVVRNLQGSAEYLSKQSDYFNWEINSTRLMNVAKALDVHFAAIDEGASNECLRFVYDNSLYAITSGMLKRVIPASQWNEEQFKKANYTYLNTSDLSIMLRYVNDNMEDYVMKVLIPHIDELEEAEDDESIFIEGKIAEGVLEDEPEHVFEILQHDWEIEEEVLKLLINKEIKKWKSVEAYGEISDEAKLWLYECQKVELTWENVLYLFELDKETFADYIRKGDVAFDLSMMEKPDFDDEERATWEKMQDELLSDKMYEDVAVDLVNCFDKEFDASVIKHCRVKILDRLIERKLILRGKEEYAVMDEIDPALSLTFFLINYGEFAPMIEELELKDFQIEALLRQKDYLTEEQKLNVLEHVNADEVVGVHSVMTIVDFFQQLDRSKYEIREGVWKIIKAVLIYKDLSTLTRLRLFNKYSLNDHKEIDQVVALLDRQYVDERGKLHNHLLPVTDEILMFSKYLEKIRYLRVSKNYAGSKGYISIKY